MALSTQIALPSGSSAAPRWKYDVFLSFRGEDTRRGFVSHLYHELQYWQTIKTFKDDPELEIGASISPELLRAIEESHLAIVVFSPNYASSTWCLDELAKIVESMETKGENTLLPVFFNVDPCDVRYQMGSFAEAFAKHEERFSNDNEKVKRWRTALRRMANLSGWDSKNYGCERELIKDVVRRVWSKVHPRITLLDSTDKLVGIDFRKLDLLLAPEVNDVRFIGIWGMGGVGKTTLAKLVFERISHHFTVTSFLVNVRDVSARHGTLVNLQKQLLFPIMKENIACVWDEEQGTYFIREFCSNKKVLLVVDDIDQHNQLKLLVGNRSWFGEGSRILVTTRDERILTENDIICFKVNQLNHSEALQLFSQNAFRRDEPEEDFLKLSECFVGYAKGLPLALTTMGRSLYKRNLDAWSSVLDKLKKNPIPTIFDSLKLSYNALDDMERNILLDIAFFYKGMVKGRVIEMLDSCGLCGRIGIDVLIEKSLLTGNNGRIVEMHDLIQEMAKEIVRQESPNEPGLRSRLCNRDDINHVFVTNTGTEAIKGISLRLPPELEAVAADPSWNNEGFSKMPNLTNLEFDNFSISSAPKFLPNSLRSLKWSMYPSKSLPASYKPNLLVELQMRDSKLVGLWDGKLALSSKFRDFRILRPGSKIPKWFNIQSEGDSLTVELPSDRESCGSKWVGIAVCALVAADPRYRAAPGSNSPITRIECSGKNFIISWKVHGLYYSTRGEEYYIMGDHVAISLIHRRQIQDSTSCHVNFQCLSRSHLDSSTVWEKIPAIKRCGARLVYEQDLEELFHDTRNMVKRSREYCQDEEHPSGTGSRSSNQESLFKRPKPA